MEVAFRVRQVHRSFHQEVEVVEQSLLEVEPSELAQFVHQSFHREVVEGEVVEQSLFEVEEAGVAEVRQRPDPVEEVLVEEVLLSFHTPN